MRLSIAAAAALVAPGAKFGSMKKTIFLGALLALATTSAAAQSDTDDAQIRQVIGVYFRGHATANADTMRAAFMPTAHIEGVRNGVFTSWTVDQYVAGFRGTPAQDEAARVRVIDVVDKSGTAAMVRATLKHGATTFTDYFVLLKVQDKWLIANKVYHAQR
jgi:hypothetical protein